MVTYEGNPVVGATVVLVNMIGAPHPYQVTTTEDGKFDFGPRDALPYKVSAIVLGRAPTGVKVDLRSPFASPETLRLRLEPCVVQLSGSVLDVSGGVVVGARVQVGGNEFGGPFVYTDEDGLYRACLSPGYVEIRITAAGYGGVTLELGELRGVHSVDVSLVPEATILGQSVDDAGMPVPFSHVVLRSAEYSKERPHEVWAVADADGQFSLTGVAPGRYLIVAHADGYLPSQARTVLAAAARQQDGVVCVLRAGATVHGRVVVNGRPVANATLRVTRTEPRAVSGDAVTQMDGTFVLRAAPPGDVVFEVDGFMVVQPLQTVIEGAEQHLTIEVARMASISGRVLLDGTSAPNAEVHVRHAGVGSAVLADSEGRFVVAGLTQGTYRVSATSADSGAYSTGELVDVAAGKPVTGIEVHLDRHAAISGTVVDQDGAPLQGVDVGAERTDGRDWARARTDALGAFVVGGLAGGGDYELWVSDQAGARLRVDEPTVVRLDDGERADGVVARVWVDAFNLSGVVLDATGRPQPDAVITIRAGEPGDALQSPYLGLGTKSDTEGHFAIPIRMRGTYAIEARTAVGASAVDHIQIDGDETVVLEMSGVGAIEGRLTGFVSQPIVTARLEKTGNTTTGDVETDYFNIRGLVPGTYRVMALSSSSVATTVVEVAPGELVRANLTGSGQAFLSGRVVEASSQAPLPNVECLSIPLLGDLPGPIRLGTSGADGSVTPRVSTDERGRFALAVPAGTNTVRCSTVTDSGGSVDVSLAAGETKEIVIVVARSR